MSEDMEIFCRNVSEMHPDQFSEHCLNAATTEASLALSSASNAAVIGELFGRVGKLFGGGGSSSGPIRDALKNNIADILNQVLPLVGQQLIAQLPTLLGKLLAGAAGAATGSATK